MRLVICSFPTDLINDITQKLLETKLISCVNAIPGVKKTFLAKEVCTKDETLLLIQTPLINLDELFKLIADFHPDKFPEIIAFPIIAGHQPYLQWAENKIQEASNQ